MSGRPAPASEVIDVWVSKSTYRVRPADSTTRRSCVSPQTPRVVPERSALASDSVVDPQRLVGLVGAPQLLGERAELRVTVAFELVDLGLHRVQRLLHGGECPQHGLLAALALFARRLVGSRLGGEFAVEQLLVVELGLHARPSRPRRRRVARAGRRARAPCGPRRGRCREPSRRARRARGEPITTPERMSASIGSGCRRPPTSAVRRGAASARVGRASAVQATANETAGASAIAIWHTRTEAASASPSMSSRADAPGGVDHDVGAREGVGGRVVVREVARSPPRRRRTAAGRTRAA